LLLKAVEETCLYHEFSRNVCPEKPGQLALASYVGERLKASSDIYDKGTFSLRRRKAMNAGLIGLVWLMPDGTETKYFAEKKTGYDFLFLTDNGRDSLREARHEDVADQRRTRERHEDIAEG